ncbi:MAG: ComF family protein [Planctomycetes bacterium]|nr:ComF family protein [Planctomycetota bacterium]
MARTAWLRKAGGGLLDLLFPPSCLACEAALEEVVGGVSLCESCLGQLASINGPVCQRCAQRVPEIPGDVADCGHCREDKLRFDRALAWGKYEGLLRELLLKMKHDRSERLARMFSRLLIADLGEKLSAGNFDAVVAVPMSGWRRFVRGTNPPAVMAQIVGRELGVPFMRRGLRRRNSYPQKGLSRPARFRNMKNEMWAKAGYHLGSFRVLLIDDILTTGATCSEAARVLKQVGAAEVTVLVVGRTSAN